MNVVIRNAMTGKFVFSERSWTDKRNDALDFEHPDKAKQFCQLHNLREVEILVRSTGQDEKISPVEKSTRRREPTMESQFAETIPR